MKTFIYLLCSLWLSLAVHAAELKIETAMPIVEINKTVTLSVANTKGMVNWTAGKGKIQGKGNKVIYLAPDNAEFIGLDTVTVSDSKGSGMIEILITLPNNFFSPENAQWKVLTNRSQINALLLSDDRDKLWVGTNGGLEQWDTQRGGIKKILTRSDGLPSNKIISLASDHNGGLWFATEKKDIVHLDSQGKQKIYSGKSLPSGKPLPYSKISNIVDNNESGIWFNNFQLSCEGGSSHDDLPLHGDDLSDCDNYNHLEDTLVYLSYGGEWIIYNDPEETRKKFDLLLESGYSYSYHIGEILPDGNGGVWLTVYQDQSTPEDYIISYIDSDGNRSVKQADDAEYKRLYNQYQQNTPRVGDSGLIYLNHHKDDDTLSRTDVGLLFNSFNKFIDDHKNGLWVLGNEGVLHIDSKNKQLILHEEKINVEPFADDKGGIWVTSNAGIVHFSNKLDRTFHEIADNIESAISDENGGIWVQTITSAIHISSNMERQDHDIQKKLLDRNISSIRSDEDGLWIKMSDDSFSNLNYQGEWTEYSSSEELFSIIFEPSRKKCSDGKGGWWYGSELTVGKGSWWTVYGSEFMQLWDAMKMRISVKHQDNQGRTRNNIKALGLSDMNHINLAIKSEYCDEHGGGMWMITSEDYFYDGTEHKMNRITHINSEGEWRIYDELGPALGLITLDTDGSLWVSLSEEVGGRDTYRAGKGLAYLNNEEIRIYTKKESELPDNNITHLLSDPNGGVWIATVEDISVGPWRDWGGAGRGLAHLSKQRSSKDKGKITIFTTEKTVLPSNNITSILLDKHGGLWIGSNDVGELAHLTFGRYSELCTQAEIKKNDCKMIIGGKYAAIIVAAGGAARRTDTSTKTGTEPDDTLWENTEAITTHIYHTLYLRGFNKSNIYYLSSKTWADFDGDGKDDDINRISEDRYLTLDDLKEAFEWAKRRGKLDQPFYFFFMDHGSEDKLHLAPNLQLSAEEIKPLLDEYQRTTGNQLIVVLEACHSGSLIPELTAPNRAIITSAKANEKAYFLEKEGFSHFFSGFLRSNGSFLEAFRLATPEQDELRSKLQYETEQTPQLDDNNDGKYDPTQDGNWLKTVYINGNFPIADDTLVIKNLTPAATLSVGQPVQLQLRAKVTVVQGTVNQVWAVIYPPKMAQILDTSGTPILAFPRVNLVQSTESPNTWQATWNDATYNGNYTISFYAKDNEKNIASSKEDTILTVTGGIVPPTQAQVQIHLDKTRYQRGEQFKATLTENLGWGYDLYVAVDFPESQDRYYFTGKNTNELRGVKKTRPWHTLALHREADAMPWFYPLRKQGQAITLFDLTLPKDLPTGQYCLYGILSPEKNDLFEAKTKKLTIDGTQCFEVF